MDVLKPFWISWWVDGSFELHAPWWFSGVRWTTGTDGEDNEQSCACAAVMAKDEEDAKRFVRESHDDRAANIEWRFCEERPRKWQPFSDRFPRADWMQWA